MFNILFEKPKLFSKEPFFKYEQKKIAQLKDIINTNTEFNDIEKGASEFINEFLLERLTLDRANYDRDVTIERVPIDRNKGEISIHGDYRSAACVTYTFKLNWNRKQKTLAYYYPTSPHQPQLNIDFIDRETSIQFLIPTRYARVELPDEVIELAVQDRDKVLNDLETTLSFMNEDIDRFNSKLHQIAVEAIQQKIEEDRRLKTIKSKL
jgi:hypothetical protein